MTLPAGVTFAAFAQTARARARDGSLGAEEAQRLLTELGERAADLSSEDVRQLLLRISSVLVAVAARTADSAPGDTNTDDAPGEDRLLTVEEAASRLSVQPRWLYKNQHRLPFTKKLSRKALRFSEKGLQRWLERGRPAPRTWGQKP